mgnify:CR=1 FL=1
MITKTQQATIDSALSILGKELNNTSAPFTNPIAVSSFCKLKLAAREQEVFGVLHLNSQHQLIDFEEAFFGTIDAAAVYPREIAKSCLYKNSAAVIFTHNHPSGIAEPSQADRTITTRLVDALQLIDVRTLDHIVVGANTSFSFAEKGWL